MFLNSVTKIINWKIKSVFYTNLFSQARLTDEQAVLCEVKKQQLKVLDDQQKVYADDLTKSASCSNFVSIIIIMYHRSVEDTERVRHKYLKAKKIYEDKVYSPWTLYFC